MFEQRFCGECGQMKRECICLETGHIDELLAPIPIMTEEDFPWSDVIEVLTEEVWDNATNSEQIDAAILDGLPMKEYRAERNAEQQAEYEAEARMGGDNHYYEESYEEAEMRFVDSLPPAGVDPEWYWEYNEPRGYPFSEFDEYDDEMHC